MAGNSGRRYYFEDYYNKKLDIENNRTNKKIVNKWKFKNTIKIELDQDTLTSGKDIFQAIKTLLTVEEVKQIISISLFQSNRTWTIKFKETFDLAKLINKSIRIQNKDFPIYDANMVTLDQFSAQTNKGKDPITLTAVLRIHRLPADFPIESAIDYIQENVPCYVMEKAKEHHISEGMEEIENGVIRSKINYEIAYHQRVLNLIGVNRISSQRCVIQLSGHPPKCNFCKNFGHTTKDCEKSNLKCEKCKKKVTQQINVV